jgi:hypothetical protein
LILIWEERGIGVLMTPALAERHFIETTFAPTGEPY